MIRFAFILALTCTVLSCQPAYAGVTVETFYPHSVQEYQTLAEFNSDGMRAGTSFLVFRHNASVYRTVYITGRRGVAVCSADFDAAFTHARQGVSDTEYGMHSRYKLHRDLVARCNKVLPSKTEFKRWLSLMIAVQSMQH